VPLEHGLHSTLFAMRLGKRLGVDSETASQTYYSCLLFYIGCTAGAELAAELFGDDDALTTYATPGRFGSRLEMMTGFMRALAPPGNSPPVRALQIVRGIPRAASALKTQVAAQCEVGQMLTDRLGLPTSMRGLFAHLAERWDGKGQPGHVERDDIPLPVRIVHVARDAAFQRMLGGEEFAARVIRERGGSAFDPDIAARLADGAAKILALDDDKSAWEETLDSEPTPRLTLEDEAIDEALSAMGDFSDLVSRFLVGHSAGVTKLATAAARQCGFEAADVAAIRRAALVHDLGRVAVPIRIWNKAAPLTPDDWERVRLHAYHSERVLSHSPFFAALAPVATTHHERLDGSGYHRGIAAAALTPAARVLAAADAYHAMTEPRPHREALSPEQAAAELGREASAGRLDARRRCRSARGRWAKGPAHGAPGRTDRSGGPGRRPAGARPADEADRTGARDLGQDGRPPHPERLRKDGRVDARGGGTVRDAARARGMGRTPDFPHRPPLVASSRRGDRRAGGNHAGTRCCGREGGRVGCERGFLRPRHR
jgi:HD-GYP domain-containing protein (c-di-GMP phosphodiesterase class II)